MKLRNVMIDGMFYKEIDVEQIAEAPKNKLGDVKLGVLVDIGGMVIRPIAHEGDTTLCLLQDLYEGGKRFVFGDSGNWAESQIRKELNTEFYEVLAEAVGEDNICPIKTNLWAWDGTRPYENCEDKVALLDIDQYRQHRQYIDEKGSYHWLVTPDGKAWTRGVCIVCDDGTLSSSDCYDDGAVRPFCILKSNILVSEEEK